jgi:hypothetical protein
MYVGDKICTLTTRPYYGRRKVLDSTALIAK